MCGIAGLYCLGEEPDRQVFDRMVDIVSYRGPDGRGTYYDGNLALGHRRLAIIETTEKGAQPFIYCDRYVVVFNGEIYNYLELREELERKGFSFSTGSDTEVLIACYACFGEECVRHFNGMWAFTIYDSKEKTLFCSRDRFGIKPFYYHKTDEMFAFGSEIKQILCLNGIDSKADRNRLMTFIILGEQDYSEQTMFDGVLCLRPGCSIHYDLSKNEFSVYKYHDLRSVRSVKRGFAKDCEDFRSLFFNSVKLRLRSDVPVGYCLSGGLDSSSIVCCADRLTSGGKDIDQHSVSSCFDDPDYDERDYIDEVLKATSVASHRVFPDINRVLEEADDIIYHMDEPFESTSIYSQWNVFREAKKHGLTVMLDGQGADEQLGGYAFFYSVRFSELLRHLRLISFIKEFRSYYRLRAVCDVESGWKNVLLAALYGATPIPGFIKTRIRCRWIRNKYSFFSDEQIRDVYRNNARYSLANSREYILSSIYGGMQSLLRYEDRDSMAFSIESRVPFLDKDLVERVFSMPFDSKNRDGITKAVLREGLSDILPARIKNRYSKLGFASPEDKWMRDNAGLIEAELREACDNLSPLLDKEKVIEWYRNNSVKRGDYVVWRIICAGRWVKVFNVAV